ncbi:MAG: hypothetical protein SPH60_00250, partial [Alistipes senegalensis]|nr:hypothetical protein [Alistipes senegalensis]
AGVFLYWNQGGRIILAQGGRIALVLGGSLHWIFHRPPPHLLGYGAGICQAGIVFSVFPYVFPPVSIFPRINKGNVFRQTNRTIKAIKHQRDKQILLFIALIFNCLIYSKIINIPPR